MEPAPKRGETSSAPIRPGIGDNWRMAVRIKMPPDVRLAILIAVAVMAVFVGLYSLELAIPKRDYFIERRGTLVTADVTEASTDGIVQKLIRLESTTGLRVKMRVVRPQTEPGATLPVIIVMGGEGTGKDAVDLVGEPKGVAYLALDYPYEGDQELDAFWESLTAIPGIQQAFLDSPPAMSLALDWALQQTWVDPDKVELVGASLGVPFTAVAGALDDRFTRDTSKTNSCAACSPVLPFCSSTATRSRRSTGYRRSRPARWSSSRRGTMTSCRPKRSNRSSKPRRPANISRSCGPRAGTFVLRVARSCSSYSISC
jgi:hypothetical protein